MTDRELLEKAAKAAGRDLTGASWGGSRDGFYWVIEDQPGRIEYWNPITDDGDALRLADDDDSRWRGNRAQSRNHELAQG